MGKSVLVEYLQGIAVISINRSEAFNSFDEKTVSALGDRLEQAACGSHSNGREGISAFVEKRPARFNQPEADSPS